MKNSVILHFNAYFSVWHNCSSLVFKNNKKIRVKIDLVLQLSKT